MTTLTQLTQAKLELLGKARNLIDLGKSDFVCLALNEAAEDTTSQKVTDLNYWEVSEDLKNYVRGLICPFSTIETFLSVAVKNDPPSWVNPELLAKRNEIENVAGISLAFIPYPRLQELGVTEIMRQIRLDLIDIMVEKVRRREL